MIALNDENLKLWLGKPAPRYTSYPPAPHFSGVIGGGEYAGSLRAIERETFISLYVHVPFCAKLCLYCGCNTAVTKKPERLHNYLQNLKQEAGLVAAFSGRKQVSHLHFGGGTPNLLSDVELLAFFAHLRRVFDFSAIREIAMELDPRHVTAEQADILAQCGVSRVSLGVQDFDPAVQEAIGRVQPFSQVEQAVGWLRAAGIQSINLDLIYGLPRQTVASVTKTAALATQLQPQRIVVFSYAHVPQFKKHQMALEAYGLPDIYEKLQMEQAARQLIANAGYLAIGMDHFAKVDDSLAVAWREGRLRRNFQGYTDDRAHTLIGLGASAISQSLSGYFQNEREEFAYQEKIAKGEFAICRGYVWEKKDRLRHAVIERLMCYAEVDLAEFAKRYDYAPAVFDRDITKLAPFVEAGLIAVDGYKLRAWHLPPMAMRVVAAAFDGFEGKGKLASLAA